MVRLEFEIFNISLTFKVSTKEDGSKEDLKEELTSWPKDWRRKYLNHELIATLNGSREIWLSNKKNIDQQVINATTKFLTDIDQEALNRCISVPKEFLAMNEKDEIIKQILYSLHSLLDYKGGAYYCSTAQIKWADRRIFSWQR